MRDDNLRLMEVDSQNRLVRQQIIEVEAANKVLKDQLHHCEAALAAKQVESSEKDEAIRMIDLDVQTIQNELEKQEKGKALLQADNDALRRDVESLQFAQE